MSAPAVQTASAPLVTAAEEKIAAATQLQLTWWRFRKHKLAVASGILVVLFYIGAILADFLAVTGPHSTDAARSYIPPQPIHWYDDGAFKPHVYALKGKRDMRTFKIVYAPDPSDKRYLQLFARGYSYSFLGLFETDRHLLGLDRGKPEDALFLLGTDQLGRDVWSRLMLATRTSLTVGLVGVALSLFLGVLLGGISGLYGGVVDTVIQRMIEILRSIPTIPLWMGLAAALPNTWSVTQVYIAITVIISLIGWTELARVVRGRFLALREEDFVTAAELAGASRLRIIFRHMVPSFLSHRHPRLQLPWRRPARRGGSLWLTRSCPSAAWRPSSTATKVSCAPSMAPPSISSRDVRLVSSVNPAVGRASPRAPSCASSNAPGASKTAPFCCAAPMAARSTSSSSTHRAARCAKCAAARSGTCSRSR
jgi:peptide/nickel transport system permease protein